MTCACFLGGQVHIADNPVESEEFMRVTAKVFKHELTALGAIRVYFSLGLFNEFHIDMPDPTRYPVGSNVTVTLTLVVEED